MENGKSKLLFISGPIGLGHVGREVEIAKELRKLEPGVEILWYAEDPARMYLEELGEPKPFSIDASSTFTYYADKYSTDDYALNLEEMFASFRKTIPKRVEAWLKIIKENRVDVVVADETMEFFLAMTKNPEIKQFKLVYMTDFFGGYNINYRPMGWMLMSVFNRSWAKFVQSPILYDKLIWIGEKEDMKEERIALFLPSRKELALKHMEFVGYILTFRPEDYLDKQKAKAELGYNLNEPLVICTVGGSAACRGLLNLCARSYQFLKKSIPHLQMFLVGGPNIDPSSISTTDDIKKAGYVRDLYKHLAAADIVVTSAGGTTTLELTALQKPFLYFPLLKHWEQNREVVPRLERQGAGVKMDFNRTTPESLAKAIQENMNRKVDYPKIPLQGARNSALLIEKVMHSN
jgi:UDP-N-acetylglucosamine:LPS N-acetylglucosamine transferase